MKPGMKPEPVITRLLRKTELQPDGCLYWTGALINKGYGRIKIRGKYRTTHRVAWELKYDAIPEGLQVNHLCHVRHCVNPDHLYLGTQSDNMLDRAAIGIHVGEDHPQSKLTEDQVLAIREDTRAQHVIAKEYGVKQAAVSDIKRRKTWKHI